MGACRYVGRVGGLAVALGIGAAVMGGTSVAWADDDATTSVGGRESSGSARQGHDRAATPAGGRGGGAAESHRSGAAPSSNAAPAARSAGTTAVAQQHRVSAAVDNVGGSSGSPAPAAAVSAAAVAAPAEAVVDTAVETVSVDPEPAAEAAPVTASVTALAESLDEAPADDPSDPVASTLAWTMAATTRRNAVAAFDTGVCTESSTACTYIMGPSGVPIPTSTYVQTVMDYYVLPNNPGIDYTAQTVFTPEGAYPVTGIKVLPLTISAEQGQTILEDTVEILQPGLGETVVPITFFGFSQSAVITSLLQRDLATDPTVLPGVDRDEINFVTVGQEMNPNGGWFSRYPGLNAASLGEYFFGSTPEDAFPTVNYTLEYDGFADSPRYPLNFLSSVNAAMGILLVHINYGNPNYFKSVYGETDTMYTDGPGQACQDGNSNCIALPTTAEDQKYYLMKTPDLPLLAPLRAIPLIGTPLADLIQPVLKVIVNLGYGDPAHGFTSATQPMANVATPLGLFPDVSPLEVLQQLVAGVGQGISDFIADLTPGGSVSQELSAIGEAVGSISLPDLGSLTIPTIDEAITAVQGVVTEVGARISAGASALYATVLATADFINSGLVSMPTYDIVLVLEGVKQIFNGQVIEGLINAIGLPIAADVGLISYIGVLQVAVWLEGILAALTGCGPAAPTTGLCTIKSLQ